MAASTTVEAFGRPGQPVLSLRRPRSHVDHVQYALRNNAMLVVAEESAKRFLCYSLVNEFSQRFLKKWAVVLTDDCSEHCSKDLSKLLARLLPSKPVRLSKEHFKQPLLLHTSCDQAQNVLVTSSDCLLQYIDNGQLKIEDFSLVILNFCTSLNTPLHQHSNHKQIIEMFNAQDAVQPRIIGLIRLKLDTVSNAVDLRQQLQDMESLYSLSVHFSTDVFAMNSYSEEIDVDCITYKSIPDPTSSMMFTIFCQLKHILQFLLDVTTPECQKPFRKLAAIIRCAIDTLILFGLWGFEYNLEGMLKILENMGGTFSKDQCNKIVILGIQACQCQFELLKRIVKEPSSSAETFSQLVYKICDIFTPYKVYCKASANCDEAEQSKEDPESREHDQNKNITATPPQITTTNENNKTNVIMNTKLVKLKSSEQMRCIIVTKNNRFAKLVSKLLNSLSSSDEKYSFIKSGYITQRKDRTTINSYTENVLRAVQQGMINVIVTTLGVSEGLLITACNVMVYFGVPDGYSKFFTYKRKVKGLAPRFVLVVPEEEVGITKEKLQVYHDIENLIETRVHDFISATKKSSWLKQLENGQLSCYAPFGEDAASIGMISSIHVLNRYCRKINRGDYQSSHSQFFTHEKKLSDDLVSIECNLYLPFTSLFNQVHKSINVHVNQKNDLELGVLKSKMKASLEFLKVLHEQGDLDDNLELVDKYFTDPETVENYELEDEGKGRAGTNKRKRAYEIKVPSFLENNMPVADQPLFLYKLEMKVVKSYTTSRSYEFGQHSPPEIELGILSRKQMPRMPKFILYTPKHDASISLTSVSTVVVNMENLDRIRYFHQHIFNDLLKLNDQTTLSDHNGYLVTPLVPAPTSETQIHFDFLERFSSKDIVDPSKTGEIDKDFSIFENKMVRRLNQGVTSSRHTKYVVARVCHELNPSSPFPEPEVAATFAEYYRNRYDIGVKPDQPLLLVHYVSTHVNFLYPRHLGDKSTDDDVTPVKERKGKTQIHLIPELCSILPLSAPVWRMTSYIPTIAHRLNTFLLADELLCQIQRETGIGCEPWPEAVPLPELGHGDSVGEERLEMMVQPGQTGQVTYRLSKPGYQCYGDCSPTHGRNDGHNEENLYGVSVKQCTTKVNHDAKASVLGGQNSHSPAHGAIDVHSGPSCDEPEKGCTTKVNHRSEGSVIGYLNHSPAHGTSDGQSKQNAVGVSAEDCTTKVSYGAEESVISNLYQDTHSPEHGTSNGQTEGHLGGVLELDGTLGGKAVDSEPHRTTHNHVNGENLDNVINKSTVNLSDNELVKVPLSAVLNSHDDHLSGDTKLDKIQLKPTLNYHNQLPPDNHQPSFSHTLPKILLPDGKLENTPPEPNCDNHMPCSPPDNHQPTFSHTLPSPTVGSTIGPNLTLILRALTARSSGQFFHSERLEVLGDAFLKLEVSLELFLTEAKKDEYGLSIFRGYLVSNDMLSKQGRRIGLPGYMTTSLPEITKKCIPPGFTFPQESQETTEANGVKELPLSTYHHQILGDKLVANCVESLIGAYLVSSGRCSARRVLVWFGVTKHTQEELDALFKSIQDSPIVNKSLEDTDERCGVAPANELPGWGLPELGYTQMLRFIEKAIGYKFKSQDYLGKVFIHTSYFRSLSPVSENYQKYEFLGDAILDYLVTLYIFSRFPTLNHGDLTDFRSALVNNFTLAFLAVQNGLHKFLRCMSPPMIDVIAQFVEFVGGQEVKQGAPWKTSVCAFVVGNPEVDESSVEVPKVLGDMFESLICAVFLDCGMDIDVVWDVFYPLFQPFIDYYKDHIPRSPVRTLQETFPDQVTFSLARFTLSKKFACNVNVVGYGNFEAIGRTPKIAKATVARKAIQRIRSVSEGIFKN